MDPIVTAAIISALSVILVEIIKLFFGSDSKKRERQNASKKKGQIKSLPPQVKTSSLSRIQQIGILLTSLMLILIVVYVVMTIPLKAGSIGTDPCPGRQNIQSNQLLEIQVQRGSTAYFAGWVFDGKDGGYLVTFNGPYNRIHRLNNGVYCPSIPRNSELVQKTADFLVQECMGQCAQKKFCSQNMAEYLFGGGKCHE